MGEQMKFQLILVYLSLKQNNKNTSAQKCSEFLQKDHSDEKITLTYLKHGNKTYIQQIL